MIEQGSPQWHALRVGKLTASRMHEAIARTKSGEWGASRANLMADLIAERLTGMPAASYTNAAMQWGIDHEADARTAYEFRVDVEVMPASFVPHPTITMSGASPDGMIGDDGLLELKCPTTATHLETLLGFKVDAKYVTQMQWQMACTGRQWCDFVSFDPRLPEQIRLFVKRFHRDNKRIAELTEMTTGFLDELDAKLAELNRRYAIREAAE